jgi:hypothetical protein
MSSQNKEEKKLTTNVIVNCIDLSLPILSTREFKLGNINSCIRRLQKSASRRIDIYIKDRGKDEAKIE